jgi:hypothetical protein
MFYLKSTRVFDMIELSQSFLYFFLNSDQPKPKFSPNLGLTLLGQFWFYR